MKQEAGMERRVERGRGWGRGRVGKRENGGGRGWGRGRVGKRENGEEGEQ